MEMVAVLVLRILFRTAGGDYGVLYRHVLSLQAVRGMYARPVHNRR